MDDRDDFDPAKVFDVHAIWCGHHLEPLRKGWPRGYLPASLALFEEAVRLDAIRDACGGDPHRIHAVIIEHGPLCCLLGDATVEKWVRLALSDDLAAMRAELDRLRSSEEDATGVASNEV